MKEEKVVRQKTIYESSIICKNFENFDYYDCYKILSPVKLGVDEATTLIFQAPKWINKLLQFRDNLAVKMKHKATTSTRTILPYYDIGSKAVFFTVVDRNDYEIVMEENDSHLNFRTSVLVEEENI